jgi:prefoldin subunit 5
LIEVDRLTRQAVATPDEIREQREETERRGFLKALAAGGVLVVTTGGLAAWQLGSGRVKTVEEEAEAFRTLADLYAEMDGADLDGQLAANLEVMDRSISDLRSAAASLDSGVVTGRGALEDFQAQFPRLQATLQWLERATETVSQRILALENSVNEYLGLTAPLQETAGAFLSGVLDLLPAAAPESIRNGLERLGEIVSSLPELLEGIYTRIIEPMAGWFSPQPTAGLNGSLVQPLVTDVLNPADDLVAEFDQLTTEWEERSTALREVLERREELRARIQQLRQRYEMEQG